MGWLLVSNSYQENGAVAPWGQLFCPSAELLLRQASRAKPITTKE